MNQFSSDTPEGVFAHTLLVSDIDGTLTGADQIIIPRNLTAIRRYCALGGRFAFATGRAHTTAATMLRQITPNAPCIFINGTELYDLAAARPIWQSFLPAEAMPELRTYYDLFPEASVMAFTPRDQIVMHPNALSDQNDRITGCRSVPGEWVQLPGDIYKLVFMAPVETISRMQAYFAQRNSSLLESNRSWAEYFELMAAGTNKGAALTQLRTLLDIPAERTFAIGDFDNDVAMLRAAGFSAAPANGTEAARAAADIEVCACDRGAVAEFLTQLECRLISQKNR